MYLLLRKPLSRSGDYCDKHLERVCNYSKNGRMELASG